MMMTAIHAVAAAAAAGPCDIYAAGLTPCVAAHSTVRALYSSYAGPLYQVRRTFDGKTKDIAVLQPGGPADSRSQDAFCASGCVIWRIYDQSPYGNHLDVAPGGGAVPKASLPVNASGAKITVGGHDVYGAYFEGGMGYSNGNTSGVAVGDEPESMYMVVSGEHFNGKCCFDYGNAEVDRLSHGPGTMEAIYFGSGTGHLAHPGVGDAPWIMGDLEAGLWGADVKASREKPIHHELVTAMLKGDKTAAAGDGHWVIKGGDAAEGGLTLYFDGARPNATTTKTPKWFNSTGDAPMKKQGAIILGTGGDNSNKDVGTFYEGCMTRGFASDATDAAVQANIIAAGYSTALGTAHAALAEKKE